eukprot:5085903-Alexandrium_andersonii.AAC.1
MHTHLYECALALASLMRTRVRDDVRVLACAPVCLSARTKACSLVRTLASATGFVAMALSGASGHCSGVLTPWLKRLSAHNGCLNAPDSA